MLTGLEYMCSSVNSVESTHVVVLTELEYKCGSVNSG